MDNISCFLSLSLSLSHTQIQHSLDSLDTHSNHRYECSTCCTATTSLSCTRNTCSTAVSFSDGMVAYNGGTNTPCSNGVTILNSLESCDVMCDQGQGYQYQIGTFDCSASGGVADTSLMCEENRCNTISNLPEGSEGTSSNGCVAGVTNLTAITATTCGLQCQTGFSHTTGNNYYTCYSSGGNPYTDFVCTRNKCTLPSAFAIGAINVTCPGLGLDIDSLTSCNVMCDESAGYEVNIHEYSCNADGVLSSNATTCTCVQVLSSRAKL